MNLTLHLGAETYVPLRAIPIITSGLFDTPAIADMIADPESYCDAEHDTILQPYAYQPNGQLLQVPHVAFSNLRSKRKSKTAIASSKHLPAGMLVSKHDLQNMFNMMVLATSLVRSGRIRPEQTVWNEDPPLSSADFAFVMENLPKPRLNSAADLQARIEHVIQVIAYRVKHAGIHIEKADMPGTRGAWSQLIGEFDQTVARKVATHQDHFRLLGYRWRSGNRPRQINPVREALGWSKI